MLKKRITAVIMVRNGWAVQSREFATFLPVGDPRISAQHFDSWGADEIALLDISPDRKAKGPNLDLIREISATCRTPLVYGGGISSLDQVRAVVRAGADKVAIGAAAIDEPGLVEEAAHFFGRQCILGVLDIVRTAAGVSLWHDGAALGAGPTPLEHAKELVARGAGELLLNSVDRDGTKTGMDIDAISSIAGAVTVPVVACGGVGEPSHMRAALDIDGVQSVAVGNILNFSEHSITVLKAALSQAGVTLRHDTHADYRDHRISAAGRLEKLTDRALRELIFVKHPEEVI
jgi:cyclase